MDGAQMIEFGRSIIRRDAAALASVEAGLGDGFVQAIQLLMAIQGKVLVAGMGTSGATARRIAHLLSCSGTPAMFIHPGDGLHGGLGAVSGSDLVVAISKGGESDELNEFCRRARARGARIVVMTAVVDSPLAGLGDCVLPVITPPETDLGEMMAMGSALAACAVGDALAAVLMERRGYDWQAFEETHPGGAVGKAIDSRR
jgi:arabinose-5-phosphate isomerase